MNVCYIMFATGSPGEPPEMICNQTMDTDENNCVLHLSWSSPPYINTNDLSHYMIHVNGTNVVNITHTANTSSWQLFAYPVCTCDSHTVSIRVVNRCGSVGPSTDNQTVVAVALPTITCPAEPRPITTTTAASSNAASSNANAFSADFDIQCPHPQNSSKFSLYCVY